MDFTKLFTDLANLKVGVIGDIMLDTYWWGRVDRISPEAPVPVVALGHKELRVGGAANVALNTVSLGAKTSLLSVIGDDADGKDLLALLQQNQINTDYILKTNHRITTNKMRVMSRNQQMMRLDAESTEDLDEKLSLQLFNQVKDFIENEAPNLLIFEDYNKGVLTEQLIKSLIQLCKSKGILTSVDPKKKNFLSYQGVDLFKPNLKEINEGLKLDIEHIDLASLQQMHQALASHLHHQVSLITLSEKGVFFQNELTNKWIPTHVRNIADVSGAGDTVIAVASLVFAATGNMCLSAEMANIAGGLVCEEVGTAAINKDKLLAECKLLLNGIDG